MKVAGRSELSSEIAAKIESAALALARARRILFITGAGISADSGLPTYRGIGGLYDNRTTSEGVPIEEALSGRMMARRPEITWRHLLEIERTCRGAIPNRGHEVIARLELQDREVWVLTQNVDSLHEKAGSTRILDIHGDFRRLLCTRCDYRREVADYGGIEAVPRCPDCGAVVRPDVVLFGEALPLAKVQTLRRELARGFDAVFSIGTTSVFPYIAEPIYQAKDRGAPTIEINPDQTEVSAEVDVKIPLRAAEALDLIWAAGRFEVA